MISNLSPKKKQGQSQNQYSLSQKGKQNSAQKVGRRRRRSRRSGGSGGVGIPKGSPLAVIVHGSRRRRRRRRSNGNSDGNKRQRSRSKSRRRQRRLRGPKRLLLLLKLHRSDERGLVLLLQLCWRHERRSSSSRGDRRRQRRRSQRSSSSDSGLRRRRRRRHLSSSFLLPLITLGIIAGARRLRRRQRHTELVRHWHARQRLGRPVPRTARSNHRKDRRVQSHQPCFQLLERRRNQRSPHARVRNRLRNEGRTCRAHRPA